MARNQIFIDLQKKHFSKYNARLVQPSSHRHVPSRCGDIHCRDTYPSSVQPILRPFSQRHSPIYTFIPAARSIIAHEVGLGFICVPVSCCGIWPLQKNLTNLPLASGKRDIHESASICYSLLGTALGGLLLLLRFNL